MRINHLLFVFGMLLLVPAFVMAPGCGVSPDDDDDDVADDDVADDDVADDDAAGDACAELCEEICACQGADHYFEMMGYESCSEGCNDLYSGLDDKACEMALVTWLDAGGCDQYLP